MAVQAHGLDAFPGHEARNAEEHDDESDSHGEVNMGGAFEPLDDLSTAFDASDRAEHHNPAEFHINVAEGAMFARCDDGFADDVSEIGSDDEVHRNADGVECWSGEKAAADAEESTKHADDEADGDQISRGYMGAGDEEVHLSSMRGLIKAKRAVVSISSAMPWQTIKVSAAAA